MLGLYALGSVPLGSSGVLLVDIAVPAAKLAVAAPVPAVASGGGVLSPASGLVLSAPAPAVATGAAVSPPTARLILLAPVPVVDRTVIALPPSAGLALSAPAPRISTGAAVSPPSLTLALSVLRPQIGTGALISPPTAGLGLAAVPPLVSSSAVVYPPAGRLALWCPPPLILTGVNVRPPAARLSLAAPAPVIVTRVWVQPPAAGLVLRCPPPVVTAVGPGQPYRLAHIIARGRVAIIAGGSMLRTRYPAVVGDTAPVDCTLIDLDSASGTDPLPLTQANSFTARARPASGGAAVDLPVSLVSAAAGRLALIPAGLTAGEWVVQIGFTDTAGRQRTYPSDGDGFRLVLSERL